MEQKSDRIRIELTELQKKQIKEESGQDVQAFELSTKELEQRIAPVIYVKW